MPDHSALARITHTRLLHSRDSLANAEKLLMPRDLAHTPIENGKAADKVKHPLWAAQGEQRSILRRNRARPFGGHSVEVAARAGEITRENGIFFGISQREIGKRCDDLVCILFITPGAPEFPGRPYCGIAGIDAVHREQDLGKVE